MPGVAGGGGDTSVGVGAAVLIEPRDLAVAPVSTLQEAAGDPHVHQRQMLQDTVLCNGTTAPIVGPAAKFSPTPTRVRRGAPAPCADTAEVLATLGIHGLRALKAAGAS